MYEIMYKDIISLMKDLITLEKIIPRKNNMLSLRKNCHYLS